MEQRIAGWLSSFEQGVDATGRQRAHIANNADLLARLLSLPGDLRRDRRTPARADERLVPDLARFPVNPVVGIRC
jgi:hypothetical protein